MLETTVERLTRGHTRLLTLTGPAGVGKTRLALEVFDRLVDRFPGGVTLVDLTPVRAPASVLPAIAQALGFIDSGPSPLLERLQVYFSERGSMLLILDNFEQVLPAGRDVASLLPAAPDLSMLVTSRVPLKLRWEETIRLAPLSVPDPSALLSIEELMKIPAVALFIERAQAQRADFVPSDRDSPLLSRLTRQLDGLPLAIELAAARMSVLPLGVIVHRLGQGLQALTWDARDLPDRQRSLQAAVNWSYQLLGPEEQRLFRHLGVFVGRVYLHAVEAVIGEADEDQILEGLMALAEKSLLLPARLDDRAPGPTFRMLETLREYAHERLEALGELEAAGRAHAHYFLELAERADKELRGRDQLAWCFRLESEHDNLRAALRWLLDRESDDIHAREDGLRLAVALGQFWWLRGYHAEGVQWLDEALRKAPNASPSQRAWGLARMVHLLFSQGIVDSQGVVHRLGPVVDEGLIQLQQVPDRSAMTLPLIFLGRGAIYAERPAEGLSMMQEALRHAEALRDDYLIGCALLPTSVGGGDHREAVAMYSAGISHLEAMGALAQASISKCHLALRLTEIDEPGRAAQVLGEALKTSVAFQDRYTLRLDVESALLLVGDEAAPEDRARLLGALDALVESTGLKRSLEPYTRLSIADFRAQMTHRDLESDYRDGRSLPFEQVAALALQVLADFEQTLPGAGSPPTEQAQRVSQDSPLTHREQEVLRLVAEGCTSKIIAQQLFLSHRTVDHHLTSIFNKLGVDTRAQAVSVATRDGLM